VGEFSGGEASKNYLERAARLIITWRLLLFEEGRRVSGELV